MKEKILAQLVTKYPGVSKKFLSIWAAKLEAKVDNDESKIEGVVNELDNLPISIPDLATEFQKEGDRRVSEAKKPAGNPKPDPEKQEPNSNEPPKGDPVPANSDNEVLALLKSLAGDVATLKGEKQKTTIQAEIAKKIKGVPAAYYSIASLPEKEEDVDAWVENMQQKYAEFKQEETGKGFAAFPPPAGGTGGKNDKAPEKEIKSLVDKL